MAAPGSLHSAWRRLPRLVENEYAESDVNKFVELARRCTPAASLANATAGARDRSLRYREILRPSAFGDELRVSLRSGATTWGALVLLRGDGVPEFTADKAALLSAVAPFLGEGVRRALLLPCAAKVASGDGLVLFDEDGRLEAMNADAERLVGELVEVGPPGSQLPHCIYGVAARARHLASAEFATGGGPARARARTHSGMWLTLHGAGLESGARRRTAVVIEPSQPPEIAPLLLQAYGLTPRESQVAQLLLAGCSVPHIAKLLVLSPYTVHDQLKALFASRLSGAG